MLAEIRVEKLQERQTQTAAELLARAFHATLSYGARIDLQA